MPTRSERRRLLTVYGRNAVIEALADASLDCRALHLADSNRPGGTMERIEGLARERNLSVRYHARDELARISRNGRQDQGVALDVFCPRMRDLDTWLGEDFVDDDGPRRLLALDGVSNPQNMGLILRSATAAGLQGIIYADKGNPRLGPLVIKASAGTAFRAPLLRCATVVGAIDTLLDHGFRLYRLQAAAGASIFDEQEFPDRAVFLLGGESDGISAALRSRPGQDVSIPMQNGVESLNVAVSAALVAFRVTDASRASGGARVGNG
jgi:23S rRNA (guanosine2251-2'-O)-methyltransferase